MDAKEDPQLVSAETPSSEKVATSLDAVPVDVPPLDSPQPKGRWERSWPTIACGAGLFSDGYLNGVRIRFNVTSSSRVSTCDKNISDAVSLGNRSSQHHTQPALPGHIQQLTGQPKCCLNHLRGYCPRTAGLWLY